MSTEIAARYLSVDEQTLLRLADQFNNPAIEIEGLSIRWRKQDLDRLIKKLPLVSPSVGEGDRPRLLKLDSSQLNEIAEQVARRIERAQPNTTAKLLSINDACAILGLGRTSVYRMIKDGALQARRIGRRTLILREELEAILDGSNRA
ncbi:helix-turn-helix domain-containing protein [Qipengyuania sp. GH29]|nr:helix-turn-helix domain-containing protein [Qipengyuania sphaerica]